MQDTIFKVYVVLPTERTDENSSAVIKSTTCRNAATLSYLVYLLIVDFLLLIRANNFRVHCPRISNPIFIFFCVHLPRYTYIRARRSSIFSLVFIHQLYPIILHFNS